MARWQGGQEPAQVTLIQVLNDGICLCGALHLHVPCHPGVLGALDFGQYSQDSYDKMLLQLLECVKVKVKKSRISEHLAHLL